MAVYKVKALRLDYDDGTGEFTLCSNMYLNTSTPDTAEWNCATFMDSDAVMSDVGDAVLASGDDSYEGDS